MAPRRGGGVQKRGTDRLSPVAENYLLALYSLREEGVRTTPAKLAEYIARMPPTEGLGTSFPSVMGMLRRLAREGLVAVGPDKAVSLTASGEALAEGVVRRHRVAERLVVDVLGLEFHRAHLEAHRLEHALSPELERRIWERLGRPTTCPFGYPIPRSGYTFPPGERLTMDKAQAGVSYTVDRLPKEDPDLLKYLAERGVIPGAAIQVTERAPYRGILAFRTAAGEGTLSSATAAALWLRRTP